MPERTNLAQELKEGLPPELVGFISKAGELAQKLQQRLYLVGGAVRDLILGQKSLDLDLVIEGDAIRLARELAERYSARLIVHNRFGTASLHWGSYRADLATARAETYERPGALPSVTPGTIADDLARRDFTINAMALELNPRHFGEIIDPHGGRQDIKNRLIRVLHERSFIDDATRIWRAIRYEQRLGFALEQGTLELLKQCTVWLTTVSGDRIRRELELTLREEAPEKALERADELGVLDRIHPALVWDEWLTETFGEVRRRKLPEGTAKPQLYLALLCYRLTRKDLEQLAGYLHLPKATLRVLVETSEIKGRKNELAKPGLPPSVIYGLLHGYSTVALLANLIGIGSETCAEHIELYLSVLRYVKPALSGKAIKSLGIPEGKDIRLVLQKLREARLDGRVNSRHEEEALVKRWAAGGEPL